MHDLQTTAPVFVEVAHQIVWCSVATIDTVDGSERPRTRILHPIWEWDGEALTGWIATDPASPKRAHLDRHPFVSCNYWTPSHDTCTADCRAEWANDDATRAEVWDRFANGPEPVGYDPSIIPGWDSPTSERFGVLRLHPWRLRVMPGSVLLTGGAEGEVLTWREP